jgi:hypothetical protein
LSPKTIQPKRRRGKLIPGRRVSGGVDVVVGVGGRVSVESGVVEAAAVGEDPLDRVVRHLGRRPGADFIKSVSVVI